MSPFAAFPYLPLDPAWIEQSEAFRHPDARLGVAYLKVLIAAWRGHPAGSIPSSHSYIASATGLSSEDAGRYFTVLTESFELLDDGRLHHAQLANLAAKISQRYGDVLEEFALSTAMTMQSPDQFGVVAAEGAKATTKGKRVLPRGFGYAMYPGLEQWAAENGFPEPRDRVWIMQRFLDDVNAKNPAYKEWDAAFRTWALKELSYRRFPPSVTERQGAGRAGSPLVAMARGKGDQARSHNAGVFGAVARRQQAAAPVQGDVFEAEERSHPRPRGSA